MKKSKLLRKMWYYKWIYFLMLPGLIYFTIFAYFPMVGVGMAFREFSFRNPFFGGAWVGLDNFRTIFSNPDFTQALFNTVRISIGRILFEFPVPIILALLFNELRGRKYKRFLQTVFTFPHFISWVVVAGLIRNMLVSNGIINQILLSLGLETQNVLTDPTAFLALIFISANWKSMGWGTIIYMATITGIDTEQYEAAVVDGANRWHRVRYITLPHLLPVIGILLTLQIAFMMSAGFDQIFNLYNPIVHSTADIIDTFIFRRTFELGESFSVATAMGVFRSLIAMTLLVIANTLVKKYNDGTGVY